MVLLVLQIANHPSVHEGFLLGRGFVAVKFSRGSAQAQAKREAEAEAERIRPKRAAHMHHIAYT